MCFVKYHVIVIVLHQTNSLVEGHLRFDLLLFGLKPLRIVKHLYYLRTLQVSRQIAY